MQEYKAVLTPGMYYHVFNRAVGKEKIFLQQENYPYFLEKFRYYILPLADIFSYCLLPNHFHSFIRIKELKDIRSRAESLNYRHGSADEMISGFLLQQFSNFFNGYTKALNKQNRRKGKLFMEPFSRKEVTTSEYYTRLVHYIHANPVHHGLCKRVEDWLHSSYHSIVSAETGWLNKEEVINWFGSVERFTIFHQQPIERKFT